MGDYARRHLRETAAESPALWNTRLRLLAQVLRRCGTGKVIFDPRAGDGSATVLKLSLQAMPGRRVRRTARHLRAFLSQTPARLTLRFEEIRAADLPQMRCLLTRLVRFADKVSIETGTLEGMVALNAWPFQLALCTSMT